jgi:hypothetical protein
MNFTRLILTIMSLIATATLLDSSSRSEVSGATGGGELFRISLAESTGASVDSSPASLEPLSEAEARAANLRAPFSTGQIEVALPLSLPLEPQGFLGRASATDCLTAAIYYEAATESGVGKRAVAQVVLNRVRHPAFPNSVCEVVMQGSNRTTGCQFTFACDGSLYRKPSQQGWQSARQIALAALSGAVEPSVGLSTHYHADYVRPYWASSLEKVAAIGTHIFYRWSGGWGRRRAFNQPLALDRDFDVHRSVQWRSAASYLYDVGVERSDMTFEAPEGQWQSPLSDIASLTDPLLPQTQTDAAGALRADREGGSLLADEIGGTLIIN